MSPISQLAGHSYYHEAGADSGPALLLLHGTGGDENDLVPLAKMIAPAAPILSPRGNVLENGMPRFFRRLAEGVFDLEDLRLRTEQLAGFVEAASAAHGIAVHRIVALGFSNGANIAASLMLSAPPILRHAILIRAMVPFQPERTPDLSASSALLSAGQNDPIVPPHNTERLADLMRAAGAKVELRWQQAGHSLVQGDVTDARAYLESWRPG